MKVICEMGEEHKIPEDYQVRAVMLHSTSVLGKSQELIINTLHRFSLSSAFD